MNVFFHNSLLQFGSNLAWAWVGTNVENESWFKLFFFTLSCNAKGNKWTIPVMMILVSRIQSLVIFVPYWLFSFPFSNNMCRGEYSEFFQVTWSHHVRLQCHCWFYMCYWPWAYEWRSWKDMYRNRHVVGKCPGLF